MLAPRTAIALIPAVAAVGSIAVSRRSGASPVLLALPGARVRFGEGERLGERLYAPANPWNATDWAPFNPAESIPSILQSNQCRVYLAWTWYYIASTRKTGPGWDNAAKDRWLDIATLKIQFYGPKGFEAQPGWVDLAERAAKRGDFTETDPRWSDYARFVRDVVIPRWNAEWAAADYSTRVAIAQEWQSAYTAATVEQAKAALPGLPDLSPGWGGFGFALGLAAVGAVAFVALRPDVAAGIAGESVARARKAGASYRAGRGR